MKHNQNGSSHIMTIILAMIVVVVGFVGYRVGISQNENTTEANEVAVNEEAAVEEDGPSNDVNSVTTQDWTLVKPKNASDDYIVRVPDGLLPSGTCATGEILFGIIYNSDSYEYDCSDLRGALGYAAIVFGTSTSSITPNLGTVNESTDVALSGGAMVIKKVVSAQESTHGGPAFVRYIVYEFTPETTGQNYYAVYRTLVGASDEDYYLQDFEAVVLNGWTISR